MRHRALALAVGAGLLLTACSSSGGTASKGTDAGKKVDVAKVVCSKDAASKKVDTPAGFPSTFPLPPGTTLTSTDDRGTGGIVVTGVTATPFKTVLAALQKGLPARGFKATEGEVEPHDAESNWTSATYVGRWAIREIPQCPGDTAVNVVARKK